MFLYYAPAGFRWREQDASFHGMTAVGCKLLELEHTSASVLVLGMCEINLFGFALEYSVIEVLVTSLQFSVNRPQLNVNNRGNLPSPTNNGRPKLLNLFLIPGIRNQSSLPEHRSIQFLQNMPFLMVLTAEGIFRAHL